MAKYKCTVFNKGIIMNAIKKTIYVVINASFCFALLQPAYALELMSNDDLSQVSGQALIVADTIVGAGAGAGFTFTRMGLDADLALNANINKFQLGCGGYNNSIKANACDIDFDFVTLMGRTGTDPGAIGSDFVLKRPYIEIATKGNTAATREVAGVKIGAQTANGYFGIGRSYLDPLTKTPTGATNLENGGVCGTGNNALNCHSGINNVSGFLHAEMSGSVPLTVTVLGVPTTNGTACFGRTSINGDCPMSNTPVYRDIIGTRINALDAQSIPLQTDILGLSGYAWITENLRFLHGFALVNTSDFGISVQREKISYPTYDKTGYSYAANAGWWMNVPDLKALDIEGARVTASLTGLLSALSTPGLHLTDIELKQPTATNCWGGNKFC
jgi:hypothetical protein